MLMLLSRRRQYTRHRVAAALPLSAQLYVAVTLLSPVRRWQCKRRHVAIALPLLSWRWQRSCLAVAVFIPTHRTTVLRTTSEATEEDVMSTSAAGKRGAPRPHQQKQHTINNNKNNNNNSGGSSTTTAPADRATPVLPLLLPLLTPRQYQRQDWHSGGSCSSSSGSILHLFCRDVPHALLLLPSLQSNSFA